MASTYMIPGVYIAEKNAFPGSAVAVATAVPVFIGYTEKVEWKGKSLVGEPTRVNSFAEFVEMFGQGPKLKFTIEKAKITKFTSDKVKEPPEEQKYIFYNCIRLFYNNGGADCYILSLGTFKGEKKVEKIDAAHLTEQHWDKLKKTFEPTLVVLPDFASSRAACYKKLYPDVLKHCSDTQSRFGIFDVIPDPTKVEKETDTILAFREGVGSEFLSFGAGYYPWLNTSIVSMTEVDFNNIALDKPDDLLEILPDDEAPNDRIRQIFDDWNKSKLPDKATGDDIEKKNKTLHQSLLAASEIYKQIIADIRFKLNLLPPSAAMAGIYSLVDSTSGVWKAPANISLSYVDSPSEIVSHEEQETMNVDAITGKSVNAIRPFPGLGSLVWGARTLDGNSQDWRYINVRRTMIMIEQSLKLACRAYVFEPNDSATWVSLKSMMNNFLNNLWKQGALAGAVPEQAFDVQVGLGATMTPTDILDGFLRVTIKLALVRPAEFIVLTFQQKQQES